jgi:CHASE3 domain sensor protein
VGRLKYRRRKKIIEGASMERITDTEPLTSEKTTNLETTNRANRSTLDNVKNTIAEKLHGAAGTLKQRAGQQQGAMSGYADKAATFLDDAAGYVREVDPQQLKTDVQEQVRRNPGRALLIAGAAGLLLGVLFRR